MSQEPTFKKPSSPTEEQMDLLNRLQDLCHESSLHDRRTILVMINMIVEELLSLVPVHKWIDRPEEEATQPYDQ